MNPKSFVNITSSGIAWSHFCVEMQLFWNIWLSKMMNILMQKLPTSYLWKVIWTCGPLHEAMLILYLTTTPNNCVCVCVCVWCICAQEYAPCMGLKSQRSRVCAAHCNSIHAFGWWPFANFKGFISKFMFNSWTPTTSLCSCLNMRMCESRCGCMCRIPGLSGWMHSVPC